MASRKGNAKRKDSPESNVVELDERRFHVSLTEFQAARQSTHGLVANLARQCLSGQVNIDWINSWYAAQPDKEVAGKTVLAIGHAMRRISMQAAENGNMEFGGIITAIQTDKKTKLYVFGTPKGRGTKGTTTGGKTGKTSEAADKTESEELPVTSKDAVTTIQTPEAVLSFLEQYLSDRKVEESKALVSNIMKLAAKLNLL